MSYSENSLFTEKEIEGFRQHGLSESIIAELLRQAEAISRTGAADNASPLTEIEKTVLRDGGALGVDRSDQPAKLVEVRPIVRALADELLLEQRSLSADAVASHLQVSLAEVAERSIHGHPQQLYGFLSRSSVRLYPQWQFTDVATVPNLAELLSAIGDGVHPVSLDQFMLRPHVDLEVNGEELSPRDWLVSGADPEPVILIATDL